MMQKISRQTMVDYAKEEAARGSIYVWGAQGRRGSQITEDLIRKMETSTTNANRAIAYWNKSKQSHDPAMIGMFDCSGLIGACLNANGNPGFDDTAEGYRNRCVQIGKSELQPGDLVFEWNGSKSNHVGIYIGGGKVAEARGRDYGVVITDLNARDWKKYGRPDFMYLDGAVPQPTPQPTPGIPELPYNLKKGMNDDPYVRMAQEQLTFHKAQPGKIDGDFGTNTRNATIRFQKARIAEGHDLGKSGADGVIGPKTWAILMQGRK